MIKSKLENYIIEQILILEQKEDLNENKKALIGLGILGMLGAFIAKGNTPVKVKSQSSVEQTIDDAYKEKTGTNLTQDQKDKIKAGKELAKRLTSRQVSDIAKQDPSVGQAFLTLFKTSDKEIRAAKFNPKNKDIPIASIEGANIDEIFIYTQAELDQYFRNETNRSVLELQDGSNILDMSQEDLNYSLSDPTSEVVKVIAEELLTSALVQQEVTKQIMDAFLSNYEDTYEDNLDIAEIKARNEAEMLRVKALQHWLKNNVKNKEAVRTIEDIQSASGSIGSQDEVDSWIELYNSGEIPDEYTGRFDSDD